MGRFRRPFAGMAVLLCTVVCAGCTSSATTSTPSGPTASATATSTATSTKPELSSIVVGVLPAVATATLYLAIKEGYFTQLGLTVTPKQLAVSNDAIPGLLHGTIDITSGNMDTYLDADASGVLPLRILNESIVCSPGTLVVLSTPRSGITAPAQLAGKTIGVPAAVNINTLTIGRLLGPTAAKTVHYVVVPFANMSAALAAGRVAAISTIEPYTSGVEHTDGAKVVLDQCGGADAGIPLGGYFTTATWAAQHPNTARAFQQAMNKAQALANSNPALIRQLLPTFMKVTPAVAAKVGIPQFATGLDGASIQQIADLAHAGGEMHKALAVSGLLFGG